MIRAGAVRLRAACAAALLLPVLVLTTARVAVADQPGMPAGDVRQWLERTLAGVERLNFEGTFVYVQGAHVEAMRITHGHADTGEWQRLNSLSGPKREVLLANRDLTCSLPQGQITMKNRRVAAFPVSLPKDIDRLERQYSFVLQGSDRVAGHETRILAVTPRDGLRFGFRLWLEASTGMIVRSMLVGSDGAPLEQMMYTDLRFLDSPPLAPSAAELQAAGAGNPGSGDEPVAMIGEVPAVAQWTLTEPPAGFEPVQHSRFQRQSDGRPTEHVVYSDGLATVSLFIERVDPGRSLLEGPSRIGAMNAWGKVADGIQAVLVGEVPAATVAAFAKGLKLGPVPASASVSASPAATTGKTADTKP